MKINLTKKQYRELLDLIYTGSMMINGIRNNDEQIKDYDEIEQYIYSFAKEFGFENLVEYDKKFEEYMPTREFDDSAVSSYIEEYDEYIFWQELVARLSRRDAVLKANTGWIRNDESGEETREKFEKIMRIQFDIEEEYEKEFDRNGLDNVKVRFGK